MHCVVVIYFLFFLLVGLQFFIMATCVKYMEDMNSRRWDPHSSMLSEIDEKENNVRVKCLEELAVDVVCSCVSSKLDDEHIDSEMLLFHGLPLPQDILDAVVARLNYVATKYFNLFIEPTIIYDRDERLSISVIFS